MQSAGRRATRESLDAQPRRDALAQWRWRRRWAGGGRAGGRRGGVEQEVVAERWYQRWYQSEGTEAPNGGTKQ